MDKDSEDEESNFVLAGRGKARKAMYSGCECLSEFLLLEGGRTGGNSSSGGGGRVRHVWRQQLRLTREGRNSRDALLALRKPDLSHKSCIIYEL